MSERLTNEMNSLPEVGQVFSVDDIEPSEVERLFHLPTAVNRWTLPKGGTIPTAASTGNHQCNGGDSWIWTDDGDNWIVERSKLPANYADYETWKAAALALIEEMEKGK